jgi:hypothetical protein
MGQKGSPTKHVFQCHGGDLKLAVTSLLAKSTEYLVATPGGQLIYSQQTTGKTGGAVFRLDSGPTTAQGSPSAGIWRHLQRHSSNIRSLNIVSFCAQSYCTSSKNPDIWLVNRWETFRCDDQAARPPAFSLVNSFDRAGKNIRTDARRTERVKSDGLTSARVHRACAVNVVNIWRRRRENLVDVNKWPIRG